MHIILLLIVLAVGIIIWQRWSNKCAEANHFSNEKQQKASLEAREKEKLWAEERILKQREVRKQRAEDIGKDIKAKAERDLREAELRRKIQDRKDKETEEEKRDIEQ